MSEPTLAHTAPDPKTRAGRIQAIRERSTRGLLTFNAGAVVHLEGDEWAVRSSRGGYHRANLADESCTCEDWTFFGSEHGIACKHVYAAAIAHATRRTRRCRPSRRAYVFGLLALPDCERCGIPAAVETDDGVSLCEGCAP